MSTDLLRYATLTTLPPGTEDDEPFVQGMRPRAIADWHERVTQAGLTPVAEPTATLQQLATTDDPVPGPLQDRGWLTKDEGLVYHWAGTAWRVEGEVTTKP